MYLSEIIRAEGISHIFICKILCEESPEVKAGFYSVHCAIGIMELETMTPAYLFTSVVPSNCPFIVH
jgi:hypothetical protein